METRCFERATQSPGWEVCDVLLASKEVEVLILWFWVVLLWRRMRARIEAIGPSVYGRCGAARGLSLWSRFFRLKMIAKRRRKKMKWRWFLDSRRRNHQPANHPAKNKVLDGELRLGCLPAAGRGRAGFGQKACSGAEDTYCNFTKLKQTWRSSFVPRERKESHWRSHLSLTRFFFKVRRKWKASLICYFIFILFYEFLIIKKKKWRENEKMKNSGFCSEGETNKQTNK